MADTVTENANTITPLKRKVGRPKGKKKTATPESEKIRHQAFKDEVDNYLRRGNSNITRLAAELDMHATVLNRKLSGTRQLPLAQLKLVIKKLVELGSLNDIAKIEALLSLRNLNLTLFTTEDWISPPLATLANASVFAKNIVTRPTRNTRKTSEQLTLTTVAGSNSLVVTSQVTTTSVTTSTSVKSAVYTAPSHNLPLLTNNSFIGRKWELAQLVYILTSDGGDNDAQPTPGISMPQVRLLTLTGPGGIGKTRLALQLGAELLTYFENGVYFVDLSDIRQPEQLMGAIARALSLKELSGVAIDTTLKNYLKTRNLLLILDNFEQLINAALQVKELLQVAPSLKVIVTSREVLHLYDEQEYIVRLMSLPNLNPRHYSQQQFEDAPSLQELASYEAIALFVQRARNVRLDFTLTQENAKAIAQICVKLEGLPLAIELAASQLKRLDSPQKILARLNTALELKDGASDRPNRHQTLRDVIDWSYGLLRAQEKELLKRLAIFASGFTLEAVEYVCGDLVATTANPKKREVMLYNLLGSLVDKNLVRVLEVTGDATTTESVNTAMDSEPAHPETRYAMLETIREYALELLEENEEAAIATRKRHADYYLKLTEEAEPRLRGGGQQIEWLNRLHDAHNNFRFALQWLIDQEEAEIANQLASVLSEYWLIRSYFAEGQQWLRLTLNLAEKYLVSKPLLAKAFKQAGRLSEKYDLTYSEECYIKAKNLYTEISDTKGMAFGNLNLGNIYYVQYKYNQARELYQQAIEIAEKNKDFECLPLALINLGNIELENKNYSNAYNLYNKCLIISRDLGNKITVAKTLLLLSHTSMMLCNYSEAVQLGRESLTLYRKINNPHGIANILYLLSILMMYTKNYTQALEYNREAFIFTKDLQNYSLLEGWLLNYMVLAAHGEQYFTAIKLWKIISIVDNVKHLLASNSDRALYDENFLLAQNNLNQEIFDKACEEGELLSGQRGTPYYNQTLMELALVSCGYL